MNPWVHHNQFIRRRSGATGRGFINTRSGTGASNEVKQEIFNNRYDNEYHVPTGSSDVLTWFHWNGWRRRHMDDLAAGRLISPGPSLVL
jgi:hypothetical protein